MIPQAREAGWCLQVSLLRVVMVWLRNVFIKGCRDAWVFQILPVAGEHQPFLIPLETRGFNRAVISNRFQRFLDLTKYFCSSQNLILQGIDPGGVMYVWISWGSIYKGKRGKIRLCLSTWEHGPHQSPLWTMLLCRSINILRSTDVKSCPGSGSLLSSAIWTFTEAKFALQHIRINSKTLDLISGSLMSLKFLQDSLDEL